MKAKMLGILMVLLLGNVAGLSDNVDLGDVKEIENEGMKTILQNFSEPTIIDGGKWVKVDVEEASSLMMHGGKPVLPFFSIVFTFPLGTGIDVNCTISEVKMMKLEKKVKPAPEAGIDKMKIKLDEEVYGSENPYPAKWYDYRIGGGLDNGKRVAICSIRIHPVRYHPLKNELEWVDEVKIKIAYKESRNVKKFDNEYELIILAPSKYAEALEKLVHHKEEYGITTRLVTLDEIYDGGYFPVQGRDEQEEIKYFIKDAIDNWNTSYVLLVGGLKAQGLLGWWFPVRYSHLVRGDEDQFISDLYYADVYWGNGSFCSWDSNGNDVFGEWSISGKDELDLIPDVYLGRLPCRNNIEVKIMVDKIIDYEENAYEKEWFKNMLLVGGDSYNDNCGFIEGELATQEAWKHMPGFTPIKVWASEGDISRKTIEPAMERGCGFAYFCGHGNPMSWNTHYPPNGTEWCSGFTIFDMPFLNNGEKLPVCVVGGCHNNQFDVNILNLLKDFKHAFWWGEWAPECWSWWLTRKIGGGAIAVIGNTGLGSHGSEDSDNNGVPDYLEILDGWLEIRFFQLYGENHVDICGKTHGQTITDYINKFLCDEQIDAKMVQQWELFGDPSLKLGGYP